MIIRRGVAAFQYEPARVEHVRCEACGAECGVERSVYVPTAEQDALVDVFRCPHLHEAWHRQAVAYALELNETANKTTRAIIQQDLLDLLRAHDVEINSAWLYALYSDQV